MPQKDRNVVRSVVKVVPILLGVYFITSSVANIGLFIKLIFTNYSGYKEHIFQIWPESMTSDIAFFSYESLFVLYYLLRGTLGGFCVLSAKEPLGWKRLIIWGSINLLFIIFYNAYLLHVTGQIAYNAIPYILMCISIILGIIKKNFNVRNK